MKKYILGRIIKSIISIFVVLSLVIIMLFTLIPRENIFKNDTSISKLKGDTKTSYMYSKWEELGYLDFLNYPEMCDAFAENPDKCKSKNKGATQDAIVNASNAGYNIGKFSSGKYYAYREYNAFELLFNFYGKFIEIDHPNKIVDDNNKNMERRYYVGKDYNGVPALMCNGCEYKYQIYFDTSFPFIHQNVVSLNLGTSYPTKTGVDTLEVIGGSQGSNVITEKLMPNGQVENNSLLLHSCKYKPTSTLDKNDISRFGDNYASCMSEGSSPSMITTSYIFGISSLILAYIIAIPSGIYMARKKGKFADKLGIAYINFLSAVPSLAFIFFIKQIGQGFGFPDKFPLLGYNNPKSYILPIIILALLSSYSLMMWTRRYMIDQSNADYVKFARAKGLSEGEIFNRHIFKNAIIPIINGIPSSIILCISGSVITETVFAIPGMGKMLPDSINLLNNNMVITLTFIFTTLSVFSLLIGDLLMTVVDPRIKLVEKGD